MLEAETVKSQPQTAHVELRLGETLDRRRIGRMAKHRIGKRRSQTAAHTVETGDLLPRITILLGHIGTVQVRKDRSDLHRRSFAQRFGQHIQLPFHKTQPVHARIELDMDRVTLLSDPFDGFRKKRQRTEIVYFGLQPVSDHQIETALVGIQNDDRHSNSPLAEQHPFVGESYGQVIDPLMLEHLGHLEIPGAVAGRLDHRQEPRTEIIQVVDHGIEIDLQYRRMALAFERMTHPLEVAVTAALDEHHAPGHIVAAQVAQQLVGRAVKGAVAGEIRPGISNTVSHADQTAHSGGGHQTGHFAVKHSVLDAALLDIRKNKCHGTAGGHIMQVVERNGEGVDVRIVSVVDQQRTVDSLLQLEAHRHGPNPAEIGVGKAHHPTERPDQLGIDTPGPALQNPCGQLLRQRIFRSVLQLPAAV